MIIRCLDPWETLLNFKLPACTSHFQLPPAMGSRRSPKPCLDPQAQVKSWPSAHTRRLFFYILVGSWQTKNRTPPQVRRLGWCRAISTPGLREVCAEVPGLCRDYLSGALKP